MSEVKCTLSNDELIRKSNELVSKLCETGGHSWCLRVPVDLNNDPDIIFTELGNRVLSLRAQLAEAQKEAFPAYKREKALRCKAENELAEARKEIERLNISLELQADRVDKLIDENVKAEAENAALQRKLNVAVRLEADSDVTFDWNVLGKIDDLERENAELRERLKLVEEVYKVLELSSEWQLIQAIKAACEKGE